MGRAGICASTRNVQDHRVWGFRSFRLLRPTLGAPDQGGHMANDPRDASRPPATGRTSTDKAVTATEAVGKDPEMVELERRHRRFVWPATAFFLIYYMSLNVLAGTSPDLMCTKLFGEFTFGYLFALSQFLMAFVVAWAYSRWAARRIDPLAADLREKFREQQIKGVAE
jgi:uncharacterized membrane protein (DUF485 family)